MQALSLAQSAGEVARVIADLGGAPAGARFANIALLDGGSEPPAARLFHAPSLVEDVARGYPVIPVDESTPLGTVLRSGGEVWLGSLSDIRTRYPSLATDTASAGLAATASLALHGQGQRQPVIGAMGIAWAQEQQFTHTQRDEVRLVARLAADALGRALMLAAERAERHRAERLQRMMTVLAASASLAEVTAAVFDYGLPAFGASAARMALADPLRPELLTTLSAVGFSDAQLARWQALPPSVPPPLREASLTAAPVCGEPAGRAGQASRQAEPGRLAGRASRPMAAAWPVPASALCARRWNDYLAAEAVFLAGVSSLPGSIGAVALMTSSVNLRWLASSCSAKL